MSLCLLTKVCIWENCPRNSTPYIAYFIRSDCLHNWIDVFPLIQKSFETLELGVQWETVRNLGLSRSWSFSFMKKREHLYAMPQFHIRVLNAASTNLSYIDWAVSFRLHILALSRGKIYRNIQAHLPDFFTALFNGSWKPRASCIQGLVPGVHWLTSIALVRLSLRHAMLSDNLISHPAGLVCRITYHLEAKTYSQVQKNCFQVK